MFHTRSSMATASNITSISPDDTIALIDFDGMTAGGDVN